MDRTVSRVQAARSGPVDASVAQCVEAYFERRNWQVLGFQRETWEAIEEGLSGLVHAPTGAGKTQAVWLGACRRWAGCAGVGPRILWITPMRALASDAAQALSEAFAGSVWETRLSVGVRSGDTSSAERTRQQKRWPFALVTTPESLSLLLARADAEPMLAEVRMLVVDEWHELIGSKRGVLLQLALAWLRARDPALQVWGMSASLGNLAEATGLLAGANGRLISTTQAKPIEVDCLLPRATTRFAWAGHLGLQLCEAVAQRLDPVRSALVFTNTRSQAELWYQALLEARPHWAGRIALHHASLDLEVRRWVEQALKAGRLQVVVCTSSLDLGVDFSPVECVLQIGSPKGVARLMQRAGRSGHQPGVPARVTLVPTHALEVLEAAAARDAVGAREIESRKVPHWPIDVLVQHMVTLACGPGFVAADLLAQVRTTPSFCGLSAEAFQWALDFVERGGESLRAYPDHHRVGLADDGRLRVLRQDLARRHRMNIGTIVSDAAVTVQFLRGARLGTVEESFVSRLRKGACFLFAGRLLELVRLHEMTAYVRKATPGKAAVPRWNGGKMPLSVEMAQALRRRLAQAAGGHFAGVEMQWAEPLLALQAAWSALPGDAGLLIERHASREGHHLFVYPLHGRQVHLGLATLLGWRLARERPASFSIAVNDYGFELFGRTMVAEDALRDPSLWSEEGLLEDCLASFNASELAQRRFREIARIAGLIHSVSPGRGRTARELQASSSLFWEVFLRHDPGNRLLEQARREVLQDELEHDRLRACLRAIADRPLRIRTVERPTPFAFPLMVERLREAMSNEQLNLRLARMIEELERAASASMTPQPRARRSTAHTQASGMRHG